MIEGDPVTLGYDKRYVCLPFSRGVKPSLGHDDVVVLIREQLSTPLQHVSMAGVLLCRLQHLAVKHIIDEIIIE